MAEDNDDQCACERGTAGFRFVEPRCWSLDLLLQGLAAGRR